MVIINIQTKKLASLVNHYQLITIHIMIINNYCSELFNNIQYKNYIHAYKINVVHVSNPIYLQ